MEIRWMPCSASGAYGASGTRRRLSAGVGRGCGCQHGAARCVSRGVSGLARMALLLAFLAVLFAPRAYAAPGLSLGFNDQAFLSPSPTDRGAALDHVVQARASVVRLPVSWSG